jgi:hypothetical protein
MQQPTQSEPDATTRLTDKLESLTVTGHHSLTEADWYIIGLTIKDFERFTRESLELNKLLSNPAFEHSNVASFVRDTLAEEMRRKIEGSFYRASKNLEESYKSKFPYEGYLKTSQPQTFDKATVSAWLDSLVGNTTLLEHIKQRTLAELRAALRRYCFIWNADPTKYEINVQKRKTELAFFGLARIIKEYNLLYDEGKTIYLLFKTLGIFMYQKPNISDFEKHRVAGRFSVDTILEINHPKVFGFSINQSGKHTGVVTIHFASEALATEFYELVDPQSALT